MFKVILALVLLALAQDPLAARTEPVRTAAGLVTGVTDSEVTVYRGVPFAAPPLGDLRWRAPAPVTPWQGVLRADTFKPMCMTTQPAIPGGRMEETSEDCLYLNLWAPQDITSGAKLPVMIWLYGGGMRAGSASAPTYWGDVLAQRGVIIVNLAYRVGVFGFLAHPELDAEAPQGTSGNYGLLDMIAGLRWVQDNIAAFGGDPDNVTIFGQSAGSFGVNYLVASPLARDLFHKAIGQSGADMEPVRIGLLPLAEAEESGIRFANRLGAPSIAELREKTADEILVADSSWPELADGSIKGGTIAVIDGYALPATMPDVFAAGKQADVPLLVGFNADEGTLFVRQSQSPTAFSSQLVHDYGPYAAEALALYPAGDQQQATRSQQELIRDNWYGWAARHWAQLHATTSESPVYFYHYSYVPDTLAGTPLAPLGASHGFELNNVFGHAVEGSHPSSEDDRRIIDQMSAYWTNFAKTGDPNGAGLPEWPEFDEIEQRLLEIGRPIGARSFTHEELNRFELQRRNADRRDVQLNGPIPVPKG